MTFKDEYNLKAKRIDGTLDILLPSKDEYPSVLYEAMRYSVFSGGKRLRPVLLMAAYELFDNKVDDCILLACALELIHTYSLIHDDLPAMDDDNLRRGKPTSHKVFGEGIAILAGDALLNLAFEIMINDITSHPHHLKAAAVIAESAGIHGMIGGQVVDLISEDRQVDAETLEYIHSHKTAALISAAVKAGAIIAGADDDHIEYLERYGQAIGMAFQISDDIQDIKKEGKELVKATYPAVYGIEASIKALGEYTERAMEAIRIFGHKGAFLKEMVSYMIQYS